MNYIMAQTRRREKLPREEIEACSCFDLPDLRRGDALTDELYLD